MAVECALKARLLYRAGCPSAEDLERQNPRVYEQFFKGKGGHDLGRLAGELRLDRIMANEGKQWSAGDCWARLSSNQRPYSLRYGAESVTTNEAAEELALATTILEAAQAGTRHIWQTRRGSKGH